MDERISPTTSGNFDKTPFAHILIYLFNKRISGTLDINFQNTEVNIYFKEGAPAKVQTEVPKRGLGHVLSVLGQITEEQLQACNNLANKKSILQGQALIELGLIDASGLVQALKKQIMLKITDVFSMTGAQYFFYNKINKLTGFGPDEIFPVHPYTVIMSGLRTYYDKLNLAPALTPLNGKHIKITPNMEKLRSFRFSTQEKQFVQYLLKNNDCYPDVLTAGVWKSDSANSVLYALSLAKLLSLSDSSSKNEETKTIDDSALSSVPPIGKTNDTPAVIEAKKVLLEKAEALTSQNYYEMLGVDRDASTEDIRRAFFILSKTFHPDKIEQEVRLSLKEAVHYIFSNLSEAHLVLTDPKTREEYNETIKNKEIKQARQTIDEHKEVREALDAESLFQRALVLLRKGEIDSSLELVDKALQLVPNEGEYIALFAHLKVLKRQQGAPLDDLENKLREAVKNFPKSERINYYLADLLKRRDKMSEAKIYFQKTLNINPRNIEAARELRLMDLQDKKVGKESLIKKIFK